MAARVVRLVNVSKMIELPGSLKVRRVLPRVNCREIGPFAYLDHFGPRKGSHFDTPPHPHAGLSTLTYVISGAFRHFDSIGNKNIVIRPGSVNWMTSGRGIVHEEQTDPSMGPDDEMHGLQFWVALPSQHYGDSPSFSSHAAATIPEFSVGKITVRLVAGSMCDRMSPVPVHSPLFLSILSIPQGASSCIALPRESEAAAYVAKGQVQFSEDSPYEPVGNLAVFEKDGTDIYVRASEDGPAIVALFGGAKLPGTRVIFDTFVLGSMEACKQAKLDFLAGKFGSVSKDE